MFFILVANVSHQLYIYIYIYLFISFFFILKAALDDDNGVHPMSAYVTVRKSC